MPRPAPPRTTEEEDRRDLIRKWENTPSPNPEFKGVTPKEAAQRLLRPRREDSRPR